jgi:DNA-binding HxlR family transcriptional regulator
MPGSETTVCPIARAIDLVGDSWTLIILRELALGSLRFDDIQAQIGASSQILSDRLKRLEHEGIIGRRKYQDSPPRHEYFPTEKGRDLDPILLLLRSWGMKWTGLSSKKKPAMELRYKDNSDEIGMTFSVGGRSGNFCFADVDAKIGKAFGNEREERALSFRNLKEERRSKRRNKPAG